MKDAQTGLFLNRIPYVKIGHGPNPIVVLNGGQAFVRRPTPARTVRDAKRIARILPSGRPLYIFGYDPAPPAGYDVGTIARDFAEIIRSEIGPASLMGISFGGFVALRLAADHPDLVDRLILMVSAHRFSTEGRHSINRQLECAWQGDLSGLMNEFGTVFRRPWFNWLIQLRLRQERLHLRKKMSDLETIVRGLAAVAEEDFGGDRSRLGCIRARTLIVGGTRDQFFDVEAYRETADMIPAAQLKLFEKETHMLPVERARAVAQATARFLRPR
jgi:pimeloyl-ACP methyl ester carboxylesterase